MFSVNRVAMMGVREVVCCVFRAKALDLFEGRAVMYGKYHVSERASCAFTSSLRHSHDSQRMRFMRSLGCLVREVCYK